MSSRMNFWGGWERAAFPPRPRLFGRDPHVPRTSLPPPRPPRPQTTKSYMVHDAEGKATVGDFVELVPCKPLSKAKRFTLGDIVRKVE